MKDSKLSIIITAYNQEKYIDECVKSVVKQDYLNKEIIVVNDGSSDNTLEILKRYSDKKLIRLITHSNKGVGYCRNEALEISTGNYVTFVDGDDKIRYDTYSQNMRYFTDNRELDCVVYPILYKWKSDNEECIIPEEKFIEKKSVIYEHYLKNKISFSVCDKIIKKSTIVDLHFREDIRYEDIDANNQILKGISNILISPKGLYYYRANNDSFINSRFNYKKIEDYFDVTFSFLEQSQQNEVNHKYISYYLSKWLRIKYFLIYPLLSDTEKNTLIEFSKKVRLSKSKLISHLLDTTISIRKFRALWAISEGDIYKAILISNSEYDKKTYVDEYLKDCNEA